MIRLILCIFYRNLIEDCALSFFFRIDTNMDVSSPRTQGQRQFNRNTARGGGGFGSEVDEDRNKSRVEQQKQYQDELRRQVCTRCLICIHS